MTVSTTTAGVIRTGDGVTLEFSFSFEADTAAEIFVSKIVEQALIEIDPADYVVAVEPSGVGGTVTFTVAPVLATSLYIFRQTTQTQLTSVSNQTRYNPQVIERVWDKLTFILQELSTLLDRAVKTAPGGDPDTLISTLVASSAAAEAAGIAAAASAAAAATFNPALYGALAEAEVVTGAWDFSGLIDFSNNVNLTGTNYILLGPSDEGKIRYNGSALVLNSALFSVQNLAGTETMLYAAADGAVQLFYDNAQKLVTYASGVSITGNLIADTLSGNWVPTQAEAEAGVVTTKAMTPIRTKQAIDAQVPALVLTTVLLGTLTTTSGASQTLSSLTLTSYKFLRLVFHGVSAGASGNITVDGSTVVVISGGADTFRGIVDVELVNGTFSASLANTTANAGAVAQAYSGDTNLTTASTSVVVAVSTGAFDAGSIRIYGVK